MRLQKDGAVICPLYQEEKLSSKNKPFGRYGFHAFQMAFGYISTYRKSFVIYLQIARYGFRQQMNDVPEPILE